jgi:hypothetical protein
MRLALLLLLALSRAAWADEPAPSDVASRAAAWRAQCDAHLLARAWGMAEDAAVARAQAKVAAGQEAEVAAARASAAATVTPTGFEVCPYHEAGLTYDDATALALYWNLADPYEAKVRVETKLLEGQEVALVETVDVARASFDRNADAGAEVEVEQMLLQTYFEAGFDWCDAELLGRMWKTDFYSAKIRWGKALIDGSYKALYPKLRQSRKKLERRICVL